MTARRSGMTTGGSNNILFIGKPLRNHATIAWFFFISKNGKITIYLAVIFIFRKETQAETILVFACPFKIMQEKLGVPQKEPHA